MRRIARLACLALPLALCGCRSINTPWATRTVEHPDRPLEEPEVRTARDAVPDAVMLRNQTGSGYVDSPVGP